MYLRLESAPAGLLPVQLGPVVCVVRLWVACSQMAAALGNRGMWLDSMCTQRFAGQMFFCLLPAVWFAGMCIVLVVL